MPSQHRLRVTWVRSTIGTPARHRATVRALGLHRLHQTVFHDDNPSVRGMLHAVRHLVLVETATEEQLAALAAAGEAKPAKVPAFTLRSGPTEAPAKRPRPKRQTKAVAKARAAAAATAIAEPAVVTKAAPPPEKKKPRARKAAAPESGAAVPPSETAPPLKHGQDARAAKPKAAAKTAPKTAAAKPAAKAAAKPKRAAAAKARKDTKS